MIRADLSKLILWGATLAFMIMFTGACATTSGLPADISLPTNINIESDPEVPKELAGWLGVWSGEWTGIHWDLTTQYFNAVLVVEKITPRWARVILAQGIQPKWNLHSPRWFRKIATVENGILRVEWPELTIRMTFTRHGDLITGDYRWGGGMINLQAKLTKISLGSIQGDGKEKEKVR